MNVPTKSNEDFKITGNWEVLSKGLQKNFPQLTKDEELLKPIETRLTKKSILTNI
jgi:hypothetical protein